MADNESPHTSDVTEVNARAHFDSTRVGCTCDPPCHIDDLFDLSLSFAQLGESNRINAVRFMLLPLTSPPNHGNDLLAWDPKRALIRKWKLDQRDSTPHNHTVYAVRGRRICRHSFAAVVQLNVSTVNKHAQQIANGNTISPYNPAISNRRTNILSPQSVVATTFLLRYGELNGLQCPTGRGSTAERPLTWLSSDTTRQHVYEKYCTSWKGMMDFYKSDRISNGRSIPLASTPLTRDAFLKVWRQYCGMVKIMKVGSDYCDRCTQLCNILRTELDDETRDCLTKSLADHKAEAAAEFDAYIEMQRSARDHPSNGTLHLVFYFAEKVLLPSLLRQPG